MGGSAEAAGSTDGRQSTSHNDNPSFNVFFLASRSLCLHQNHGPKIKIMSYMQLRQVGEKKSVLSNRPVARNGSQQYMPFFDHNLPNFQNNHKSRAAFISITQRSVMLGRAHCPFEKA